MSILQVVLGFDLTPATALSHTIVACSAIASSIYGLIAESPNDPRRTLIDWDLTIFIPALLVGVSIGELLLQADSHAFESLFYMLQRCVTGGSCAQRYPRSWKEFAAFGT